jgi:AcrR family transcriptional regulator
VFGHEGYARATLAQVARKAGVSAGTVSHYFGSKAALFEAMVEEEALEFVAVDPLIVDEAGGYRALLHRVVLDKWARLNQPGTPELTLTVLGEMRDFPASAQRLFRQVSQRGRERLQSIIAAGDRAGEFAVSDPVVAAHVVESMLLGAILDYHFVSECTDATLCRDAARTILLSAIDRLVGVTAPVGPVYSESPEPMEHEHVLD